MSKNVVPIITCSPWKPVDIKKIDPNTLSAIVNCLLLYSSNCKAVKYIPSIIVIIKEIIALFRFLDISLWCLQVTVNPDVSRMAVFRRGTLRGSIIVIPCGGHIHPSSIVGARLL